MKRGDIYETTSTVGLYSAVIVLEADLKFDSINEACHLIAITQYLDKKRPNLKDKRVTSLLLRKYSFPDSGIIANLYSGSFSEKSRFVGNITLPKNESLYTVENGLISEFPYCGEINGRISIQLANELRTTSIIDSYYELVDFIEQCHELKLHFKG